MADGRLTFGSVFHKGSDGGMPTVWVDQSPKAEHQVLAGGAIGFYGSH